MCRLFSPRLLFLGFSLMGLIFSAGACFADDDEAVDPSHGMLRQPFDLKIQLGDSELIILDVRDENSFRLGHIPGARRVDVEAWREKSLAKGGLHDEQFWADSVGKLGIGNAKQVVVYGGNITDAARVWWTLKYLGLTHVALLDGGFDAWLDTDYPITRTPADIEEADFKPVFQADRLEELENLRESYSDPRQTVVDARSAGEFSGTEVKGDRGGRIPGAIHLEWKDLLDDHGRFLSTDELQKLFASRGVAPEKTVVTHCQSGGRASVDAFALELAGFAPVKNYYCGWQEWSAVKELPVETDK